MSVLTVENLTKAFGGVVAVADLSFEVNRGHVTSLIGPNGAGKTSVFNCITGFYKPEAGRLVFGGENIAGRPPYQITKRGICRTFQNIRLFNALTVVENVAAGQHSRTAAGLLRCLFRTGSLRCEEREVREKSFRWLEFVGLADYYDYQARQLPYGDQRRLEIARALASEPQLLLLDEPAAGLNHNEREKLLVLIQGILQLGVTVVMIEHDMGLVMRISDHIVVLDYGRKIAEGPPESVRNDQRVIDAYLGGDIDAVS
ncbi:MAG TPA: ABC transporter ATP-binding protein [Spirochaetia bacterium]|nr:ABC transporter ATP-binding protein [Spirochaetia bacterium]